MISAKQVRLKYTETKEAIDKILKKGKIDSDRHEDFFSSF